MIVASITATAIIHLFGAAALCCGGEELCDGAAAIEDYGVIRVFTIWDVPDPGNFTERLTVLALVV
jgi:hypothetical protein